MIKNTKKTALKVLIIVFTEVKRDPRVLRQIDLLAPFSEVTVFGRGELNLSNIDFISDEKWNHKRNIFVRGFGFLAALLGGWKFQYFQREHIRAAFRTLSGKQFDVIVANDIETLPLVVELARRCSAKVVLDAHEYAPDQHAKDWVYDLLVKRKLSAICRSQFPLVDAAFTVSQGIAETYEKNFGRKFELLINAPAYEDLKPTVPTTGRLRLIHHGGAQRARRIEVMIELMKYLDHRFELHLMLVESAHGYLQELQELAKSFPGRVHFHKPVPTKEISRYINQFDIGIFPYEPRTINMAYCMPNKLFEFVQGRLAVAVWPTPSMARFVSENKCGIVSEDYSIESLARNLNSLSDEQVMKYKLKSDQIASTYCCEQSGGAFSDAVLGNEKTIINKL